MRIALVGTRGFPYVYSGYETFVAEVAPRLVARGHDVTVYCHRELFPDRPREVQGVRLVYTRGICSKSLTQLTHSVTASLHLLAPLRSARPDVVLFVNAANGPLGVLLRLARVPSAINVDGLEWRRPKWRGLGARYYRWASRVATRLFDCVVADAVAMANVYLVEFNARSEVIAYGATPAWSTEPQRVRDLGLTPGEYYLVVGRLVPDNNAELIVRGFAASRSARQLVVVGDVPYRDPYVERLRSLADGRTVFTGYVRDQELLRELYCNAFAYIHGHEFGGTNPTLLKALACGCCVLALDTPFSREVLAGDRHGVYFAKNPGSLRAALESLEADLNRVHHLRETARERIANGYTWDQVTDQYEALFRRLAKARRA